MREERRRSFILIHVLHYEGPQGVIAMQIFEIGDEERLLLVRYVLTTGVSACCGPAGADVCADKRIRVRTLI